MSIFKFHKSADTSSMYRYSGIPFLSSGIEVPASGAAQDAIKIEFPRMTKFITIRNVSGRSADGTAIAGDSGVPNQPLRVGFSENAVRVPFGSEPMNYLILESGESFEGEFRVSEIYLYSNLSTSGSTGSIIAGLTPISTSSVDYNNWTGSLGVG